MSENLPNISPETASSEEDTADSKSKKKKKAIGAFIVETDPTGLLDKITGKDKKPENAKKESDSGTTAEKSEDTQENDVESNESLETGETLEVEEQHEVVSQLAAARRQELAESESMEEVDPAEAAAVEAYLAAAQSEGDIEVAYNESIDQTEQADIADSEKVIDTAQPHEGEISLGTETDDTPLPAQPLARPSAQPPIPPIGGSPTFNFNQPPAVPNIEATVPIDIAANRINQAQTEGLVVGAVVGYLVGRRRSRIKTEKRLLPVQKKLEKQVRNLQQELLAKESMVRQQVRERVPTALVPENRSPERTAKAPAHTSERIGHVIVAANLGQETAPVSKPNSVEAASARKRAESMSRQELLAVSEKVTVEGTTLRKIYETQLVSEKGLRRLVAEHLRGGNITRALKRELVEREIDFERDPILRDKDHGGGSDAAGKAALAAMLAKVGASDVDERFVIRSSSAKKQEDASVNPVKQPTVMNTADVSLISLITILTLAIIVILFRG